MLTAIESANALLKISVIESQISLDEKQIVSLEAKKKKMWAEIKDFGTADAIRADKGYAYMSKLHRQIVKLQSGIKAARKKIKKIQEEIKDGGTQKYAA